MDISEVPFESRYRSLKKLYDEVLHENKYIHLVPAISGRSNKLQAYKTHQSNRDEGVVYVHSQSPYKRSMKPRNDQGKYKYKFRSSGSFVVTSITSGKRSVGISVCNNQGFRGIGKVTIPPNATMPVINSVIDVIYLYANP